MPPRYIERAALPLDQIMEAARAAARKLSHEAAEHPLGCFGIAERAVLPLGSDSQVSSYFAQPVAAKPEILESQQHRVQDRPRLHVQPEIAKLGQDEAQVEARVVRHEGRTADEIEQAARKIGEARRARQHAVRYLVYRAGARRNRPARVDQRMIDRNYLIAAAFDRGKLADAIATARAEPGRLNVYYAIFEHASHRKDRRAVFPVLYVGSAVENGYLEKCL